MDVIISDISKSHKNAIKMVFFLVLEAFFSFLC